MKLFVVLVLSILLLTSCSACSATKNSNRVIGSTTPQNVIGSATPQKSQIANDTLEIGQSIELKNDYILKSDPESSTNDDLIIRVVPEKKYIIKSRQGIYINVESDVNSGWIPEWYVENDGMVSSLKNEAVLLIASKTNLYIAPDLLKENSEHLALQTLQAGQVVKITREFQDWYDVEFVHYEAENPEERWIKKDVTIPFDTEKCMEGIVKAGAIIYNDDFTIRKGDSFDNNPVIINKKRIKSNSNEVYYEVTGASGFNGLIKGSDFLPNPFKE